MSSLVDMMAEMFARKARGVCPICMANPPFEFKDNLSVREFHISGMCQKCQDKAFAEPATEENLKKMPGIVRSYITSHEEHEPIDDLLEMGPDASMDEPKRMEDIDFAGTTQEEVNAFKKGFKE